MHARDGMRMMSKLGRWRRTPGGLAPVVQHVGDLSLPRPPPRSLPPLERSLLAKLDFADMKVGVLCHAALCHAVLCCAVLCATLCSATCHAGCSVCRAVLRDVLRVRSLALPSLASGAVHALLPLLKSVFLLLKYALC